MPGLGGSDPIVESRHMSGHLLQTINPEAAAETHEVPEVGSRVIYYARPGQGRGGQTKFAADVLSVAPHKGTACLWVLWGREDWREIDHVRHRSEQEPYGCWDYCEDGIGEILADVDNLKAEVADLKQAIFGDFNPPVNADGSPKSVIDILAEFETKVLAKR